MESQSRRRFLISSAAALSAIGGGILTAHPAAAASPRSFSWQIGDDVLATVFNTSDCDLGLVRRGGQLWVQTSWWPDWRRYVGRTLDDIEELDNAVRDSSFTQPHGDDAYWTGGIWADSAGIWYAPVHIEFDYDTPWSYPHWTRRFGLATSSDQGANWHYQGDILSTDPAASKPDPSFRDFGDGDHRMFIDERAGYAYLYYERGWSSPDDGDLHNSYMAAARCRLEDRMAPGSWVKWYDGEWSQPGLGGQDTEVVPGVTVFMSVHYNTFLQRYVLIDVSGLYTATDLTGQNWSRAGSFPNRLYWYNTPIDEHTQNRWSIGRSLRLYSSQTHVDNVDSKYMPIEFGRSS